MALQNVSKFDLFNAFANGQPFPAIGLQTIDSIQREDGSNRCYIVTGQTVKSEKVSIFIRVL